MLHLTQNTLNVSRVISGVFQIPQFSCNIQCHTYCLRYLLYFTLSEREGFEPSVPLRVHTTSNRAPSAARSSLQKNFIITITIKIKNPLDFLLPEQGGFEPPEPLRVQWFSKPSPSAARTPLQWLITMNKISGFTGLFKYEKTGDSHFLWSRSHNWHISSPKS